jgi:hypothetical protein
VIRFAPPLTVTWEEIEWALARIERVLNAAAAGVLATDAGVESAGASPPPAPSDRMGGER